MEDGDTERPYNGGAQHETDASDDVIGAFLQTIESPHTRRAYRTDLVRFFGGASASLITARSVEASDVNRHLTELESDGLKASTCKRHLASIRRFYEWLIERDLMTRQPAHPSKIRTIRTSESDDVRNPSYLTKDALRRLVDATSDAGATAVRDRSLIVTMVYGMLRRSEAVAMDVEHVRPLGRHWVLDIPSDAGADAQIRLPEPAVDAIDAVRDAYDIASGPLWRSMSNRNFGARMTGDAIYKMLRRTASRAGLPAIGAQTLRHTGCKLALDGGASVTQVMRQARHSDPASTLAYLDGRDGSGTSAADFIDL